MGTTLGTTQTTECLSLPARETCHLTYSAYHEDIYRYFYVRLGDSALAEDLTQEVFTAALPRLAKLAANRQRIMALLYKIAERRLADALRIRYREQEHLVPLEDDARPANQCTTMPPSAPGLARTILESIDALPPSQRVVVIGHLLEGCSFSELATHLGTTEAACKTRFARGIVSVQRSLIAAGLF